MKRILVLVLVVMLMFVGCETGAQPSSSEAIYIPKDTEMPEPSNEVEKYKVGVLVPSGSNNGESAVAHHVNVRCEELSDEIDYTYFTSSDLGEMTYQLQMLVEEGTQQAVIMFPQSAGMEPAVEAAVDTGMVIVNFGIELSVEDIYQVVGDDKDMGIQNAKYIVDKIGTEGNVIILDAPSSSSVSQLRKEGFETTMKELAPNITLETYPTKFSREDGLKVFSEILAQTDTIDAVFSMSNETSIGVLQAIEETGRTDIKVVTSNGGRKEYFEMMPNNDEIWLESAFYSPTNARDAVDVALAVLKGKTVEKVKLIPITVVDRDNYEEFLNEDSPY